MTAALLIDFGSTFTKLRAVDLEKADIIGAGQGPSTVATDITGGLTKALTDLEGRIGRLPDFKHRLACSSAAGGLGMVTVGLVREIRDERGGDRPRVLLVPTKVDRRTVSGRDLAGALKDLCEAVGPDVGQRTAFSDAFNAGQWVGAYAPHSRAHQDIVGLATRVRSMLRKL